MKKMMAVMMLAVLAEPLRMSSVKFFSDEPAGLWINSLLITRLAKYS